MTGEAILPLDFGGPVDLPMTPFGYEELEQSVPERFFAMAELYGDRLAIDDGVQTLSYGEAARIVRRTASGLIARLGEDMSPVAVALPHTATFPLHMLAVLAAGRPYVPLDITFPDERNRLILKHCGARLVITEDSLFDGVAILTPQELVGDERPLPSVSPDALAYVLYTSGSTGEPKGVVQNHRNLLHDVMQYTHAAHISACDRLTQLYSCSVSGAIRDIYGALLNGASLHMLSLKALGAAGLRDALAGVTIYHSVPTVFRRLAGAVGERLNTVRLAYLAGDRLDVADVAEVRRCFADDALLYTGIGSTENATLYRHWFIGPDTEVTSERLPVGRALPDRHVRLVDGDNGVGEIEVTSRYMALGYLGTDGFPPSPSDPEARVFRTGDLGRMRPDGLLEFHGRKDDQVKIRGYRVEPAAVEGALRGLDAVAEGAIHVRRDGEPALVAYWVARAGHETADIIAGLAARLPSAMVPALAVRVPSLPMLDNFKLDRRALAAWDRRMQAAGARGELSDDPAMRRLQTACRDLLGRWVRPEDRLDDLRLDSLQWVQVQLVLEELLGRAVPADAVVTRGHQTLAELIGSQAA